eukprot:scaffold5224_cov31-Tisochrysis_lutea.AAC.4
MTVLLAAPVASGSVGVVRVPPALNTLCTSRLVLLRDSHRRAHGALIPRGNMGYASESYLSIYSLFVSLSPPPPACSLSVVIDRPTTTIDRKEGGWERAGSARGAAEPRKRVGRRREREGGRDRGREGGREEGEREGGRECVCSWERGAEEGGRGEEAS